MEKEEYIEKDKSNDAPPIACDFTNNSNNLNMNQNDENIIKNINIDNYDKAELNKHKININISKEILKVLYKEYLIDLILFLKNCCQMTIEEKDAIFNHDFFKIEKNINNINEYLINVKYDKYDEDKRDNNSNKDLNDININNDYNVEEEKNNDIINKSIEKQNNNESLEKNKPFICLEHDRNFKSKKDYKKHCDDTHKFKCQKCNKFFRTKALFNKHICSNKNNNNNYINDINEINKNDEYDKIKKVENNKIKYLENDLLNYNYQLMDAHPGNNYEKKKEEEENKEYKNPNGDELANEYYYNIWKEKKKIVKKLNNIKNDNTKKENKMKANLKKKFEKYLKKQKQKEKKRQEEFKKNDILIKMGEINNENENKKQKEINDNIIKNHDDEQFYNNNNKLEIEHLVEQNQIYTNYI